MNLALSIRRSARLRLFRRKPRRNFLQIGNLKLSLRGVSRHGGRVVVRAAPISRVARYAAITRGVDVLQAPTLLVIGKSKRARTLVGFTDTREIEQLVADVGGKRFR